MSIKGGKVGCCPTFCLSFSSSLTIARWRSRAFQGRKSLSWFSPGSHNQTCGYINLLEYTIPTPTPLSQKTRVTSILTVFLKTWSTEFVESFSQYFSKQKIPEIQKISKIQKIPKCLIVTKFNLLPKIHPSSKHMLHFLGEWLKTHHLQNINMQHFWHNNLGMRVKSKSFWDCLC